MNYVWRIRTFVFVLGIGLFSISTLCTSCKERETKPQLCNPRLAFWPADLVPHPHVPGTGPSGAPQPQPA